MPGSANSFIFHTILTHIAGGPLTTGQSIVAGAAAGVPVSLLAAPTELLKCRLQAQVRCVGVA